MENKTYNFISVIKRGTSGHEWTRPDNCDYMVLESSHDSTSKYYFFESREEAEKKVKELKENQTKEGK